MGFLAELCLGPKGVEKTVPGYCGDDQEEEVVQKKKRYFGFPV